MHRSFLIGMTNAGLLILSSTLSATSQAQASATEQTIEEVIVTATRRAESVQDVPISVSVVSADAIEATGTIDMKELSVMVPNFVFAESPNQGLSFMAIRGMYSRTEPQSIGFDSSVGVYVDGVFHSRQFNANANMGEVERVEVLRGPQGTLFGRNTISGAVNITTKKPSADEIHGDVSLEIGDRSLVHARGTLNIPVIDDTLAIKLFAEKREKDGYVDNITTGNDDLGNQDRSSGRLQLRYTPTDRTTFDLSISAYESESDDYFFEHTDGFASDGRDFTTINDFENTSEIELFNTSLVIEHEFSGGYTLTSTTAFLDDELNFDADIEATANPVVDITTFVGAEYFSQELRLASPADRRYDFIIGLYYDTEESQNYDTIFAGAGFPFPPVQNSFINRGGNTLDRDSYAAFAHANFDLNETVTLFGGLRYTDETKEQKTHPSTCNNFFTCVILGNPALTQTVDAPVDVTLDEWTWTAGLRYHARENVMIYGSVGTGIKSGAFNNTANPAGDFAANNLVTDHEEVTSYELGMKSSWLDRRVNLNLAVFHMDYDDLQVRLGCLACGPGGIPLAFLSNAGTATSEGLELEMVVLPAESLTITFGAGYVDSTYDKLPDVEDPRRSGGFFDASGNTIAFAPEWTLNTSVEHTAELMGGTLTSRLNLSYIDERFSDGSYHNNPNDLLPSQTLLSGRISYRPAEGHWRVSVWGKNLTDDDSETYIAFGNAFLPIGTNRAQFQEPRTYGVTLDYSF